MRLLRGAIEVALARGNVDEAERYCGEMESGAEAFGTPDFRAWAAHARGAVLVQQGRHAEALDTLQAALREYRTQQSRYEAAQVYEWMAIAHRGLGDDELAVAPPPQRTSTHSSASSRRMSVARTRPAV
jgi:tetratricopeptide (TPR) repeat protein